MMNRLKTTLLFSVLTMLMVFIGAEKSCSGAVAVVGDWPTIVAAGNKM